jgi:hypothetical protein
MANTFFDEGDIHAMLLLQRQFHLPLPPFLVFPLLAFPLQVI